MYSILASQSQSLLWVNQARYGMGKADRQYRYSSLPSLRLLQASIGQAYAHLGDHRVCSGMGPVYASRICLLLECCLDYAAPVVFSNLDLLSIYRNQIASEKIAEENPSCTQG